MKYSKYQKAKIEKLKLKVFDLYKQGYTCREVSDLIKNQRSYTWVADVVKELENKDFTDLSTTTFDKTKQ